VKNNIIDNDYHCFFDFYFGAMTRMDNTATAEKQKTMPLIPWRRTEDQQSHLLGAKDG
jgi:hypothetical protein